MKLNALLPLTLFLALAAPAAAAQLHYSLYVLGLPVAGLVLTQDLTPSTYGVALDFHTTGLAGLLENDRLEIHTTGRFEGGVPVPVEYRSNGHLRGHDRVIGMVWRDGNPTITAIAPQNEAEREIVPPPLRARTIDPLSVIVLLLRHASQTGRCETGARAYDGRNLEDWDARTEGEDDLPPTSRSSFSGRALRCDFGGRILAGFRLGDGRDKDLRPRLGAVWLAPVLPGTVRLPVRATIETRWLGDATIYLTEVTP